MEEQSAQIQNANNVQNLTTPSRSINISRFPKKNIFLIVALLSILILIISLAIFFSTRTTKQLPSTSNKISNPNATNTSSPDAVTDSDPLSNWASSYNPQFGVFFKYPPQYFIPYIDFNFGTNSSTATMGLTSSSSKNKVLIIGKTFTNHPPLIYPEECSPEKMPCFIQTGDFTTDSGTTGKSFYEVVNKQSGFKYIQFSDPAIEVKIQYAGNDSNYITDDILRSIELFKIDPITGWKIYQNPTLGYMINYPADYSLSELDNEIEIRRDESSQYYIKISVIPNKYTNSNDSNSIYYSLEDAASLLGMAVDEIKEINPYSHQTVRRSVDTKIDNVDAKYFVSGSPSDKTLSENKYIINENNNLYVISANINNGLSSDYNKNITQTVLNQILATFKFTK